ELRGADFVSQRPDTDADIQRYFKDNDLRVNTRCYVIDDESTVAMVACGQGLAIMPELIFKQQYRPGSVQILRLEPSSCRIIGLACLDKNSLSPAARQFWRQAGGFAGAL
ncbi:MAG: LysR family transcriptional regulator substrate-binding protein, partial [Gemmiger sp.]